ncbi:retrotransposon gag domain, retroviral aspartyl protease [Tanacetum coccineum]
MFVDLLPPQPLLPEFVLLAFNIRSAAVVVMNPYSVDKNDPNDVQLQNKDIMYDITSSVENWRKRPNDDDPIAVPHEDAQATLEVATSLLALHNGIWKNIVVLSLGKFIKTYKSFLIRTRKVEMPFPNDGEFTSENLCNIILGGRKLTFKMNTRNFYLHGYNDNNDTLWEMRIYWDVVRLKGSTPTDVGLNYPLLIILQIDREGLVTAFNHLAQMGPNVEITNNFVRLCLVLSEASRYEPIGTQFSRALYRNDNIVVDQWIHDLVKNWALLSSIAAL